MKRYESIKTPMGNIGASYESQSAADAQAAEMDKNDNRNCINCSVCSDCSDCSDCSGCSDCSRCSRCSDIEDKKGAENIGRYLSAKLIATPAQAIENLDKVREIVLADQKRLNMGHWHQTEGWRNHSIEHELTQCQTTHCLAGFLQATSKVPEIRDSLYPQKAGFFSAPVAAGMFFQPAGRVLEWLEKREYAKD